MSPGARYFILIFVDEYINISAEEIANIEVQNILDLLTFPVKFLRMAPKDSKQIKFGKYILRIIYDNKLVATRLRIKLIFISRK